MARHRDARTVTGAALLTLGLLVLAVMAGLAYFHVGGFGEPTDIGGGGLVVLGLALALSGAGVLNARRSGDREH